MYKTIRRLAQKRYICFLLVMVMVSAVLGELYYYLITSKTVSMVISLNYPGAEKGLNPDGSRFNISELTSDEILNEAKSGLTMENQSNNSIRNCMYITTQFGASEIEEVVNTIAQDAEASYVPTTFYLTYTQKNKLEENEGHQFLHALAESYSDYFYKNHAENNSVLRFEPDSYDFSDYDYTEIYDMLYDKADRMLALLNEHNSENRAFRSKENVNLSTLRDELRNFRDVELEKFNAYVVQNNISKDRPAFVNKLSYLINHSTVTYRKNYNASNIARRALEKYDAKIIAVAFIPALDKTDSFYMSRTKTGIDDLAKNSYSDGMEASRISKRIDSYQHNYQKLLWAADSSPGQIAHTDEYLQSIISSLDELSRRIVRLDDEYLEYKTEDYFSYTVEKQRGPLNPKFMGKSAAVGFILAIAVICYMEFLYGSVQKKTATARRALRIMTRHRKGG